MSFSSHRDFQHHVGLTRADPDVPEGDVVESDDLSSVFQHEVETVANTWRPAAQVNSPHSVISHRDIVSDVERFFPETDVETETP